MALLPYDKTYVIDETRGIAAATPPASLNIASIVVSETGPVERQFLRNQSDLIDLYCTGSSISATDDETIQFNGALLTQVGVDVIRVDSSAMRSGVGSLGAKMYFDTDYNLIEEITRASISKNDPKIEGIYLTLNDVSANPATEVTYVMGDTSITGGIDLADYFPDQDVSIKNFFDDLYALGVLIYSDNDSFILNPKYTLSDDQISEKKVLSGNLYNVKKTEIPGSDIQVVTALRPNETSVLDATLRVGKYTFMYGSNQSTTDVDNGKLLTSKTTGEFLVDVVNEIVTKNEIQDPWAQSIKVVVTPNESMTEADFETFIADLSSIKELCTIDKTETEPDSGIFTYRITCRTAKIVNNRTAQLILLSFARSHADNVVCTINSLDDSNPYILYNIQTGPELVSNTMNAITVTINNDVTYTEVEHETDDTNSNFIPAESWVEIDDYVFYAGEDEPAVSDGINFVKVSNVLLPTSEFIKELFHSLTSVFTIGKGPSNQLIIAGTHTIKASDNIIISNMSNIDQTRYKDSFAIVCKFTSSQALFDFEYVANNDEFKTIDVSYAFKNKTGNFTMSFDGNAMDGFGKSLYYDNYNEGDYSNPYIHITKLDGDGIFDKFSPPTFGNEVLNNDPTEADYSEAILKFIDEREKQYDFVTDAGHCSVALAGACKQVADERYAMYCPSIPPYKTVAEIKGYVEQIKLNDFRCHYVVPSHKNTYTGNFLVTMPGALSYMFARINAFNTVVAEFSPLFGSTKGAVTAPNLIKNFVKKVDSQALLDANINTIIRDSNGTYVQSGFTSQLEPSYLQDDQNAYMANVLCHVCEQYNPSIIAEINDEDLWAKIIRDLDLRITQRMITGKDPKIKGYKIICDETLNTREVIESKTVIYEVWVMFPLAVDYVKAYTYVKRLGSF